MIDYAPFWETLKNSKECYESLAKKHKISKSTLHRFKHNLPVSTETLNNICRILECDLCHVARYIPDEQVCDKES